MPVAEAWVREGSRGEGDRGGLALEGEEWLAGPWGMMRNLRMFVQALEADGKPRLAGVRMAPTDRW